ncbi:hypothetical protein GCM10010358_49080 [Streptomyces minutiscleroticus]|uniref:Uncharacterized protein n=1 Tax=Streptomyces minutiscleroticus TaxID=68238 RepID=A0A918U415_9ACTN|nr:hypothetical protein GCM10010358_49080 [Streptomyces minutiscleroticus]
MSSVLDRAPAVVPLTALHKEAEPSGVPDGDAATAPAAAPAGPRVVVGRL